MASKSYQHKKAPSDNSHGALLFVWELCVYQAYIKLLESL
jgi:hypothetical protein